MIEENRGTAWRLTVCLTLQEHASSGVGTNGLRTSQAAVVGYIGKLLETRKMPGCDSRAFALTSVCIAQ